MPSGSKPGEYRGGRAKGTPNKATAEIRALARLHAEDAITELARLAQEADSESARVAAIKELLERGYGRSPQPMDGDGEGGPIKHAVEVRFVRPGGSAGSVPRTLDSEPV